MIFVEIRLGDMINIWGSGYVKSIIKKAIQPTIKMKTATLKFSVILPFEHEHYRKLLEFAVCNPIKRIDGYEWIFNIVNYKEVAGLLGQPIIFGKEEVNIFLNKINIEYKEIGLEPFKGKSGFEVIRFPKAFKIIEYCKIKTKEGIKVSQRENMVPIESVQMLWSVIKKYPLNKQIKTRTVAENFCKEVGLYDYFARESGSFDFAKFFGKRSKGYMRFYYPLKVLCDYGVVKHYHGSIERCSEEWDIQSKMVIN